MKRVHTRKDKHRPSCAVSSFRGEMEWDEGWNLRLPLRLLPLRSLEEGPMKNPSRYMALMLLPGQELTVMSEELRLDTEPANSCHWPLRDWRVEMNKSNYSWVCIWGPRVTHCRVLSIWIWGDSGLNERRLPHGNWRVECPDYLGTCCSCGLRSFLTPG